MDWSYIVGPIASVIAVTIGYGGLRWNKQTFLPARIFHRKPKLDPIADMCEWKANRRKEEHRFWLEEWARLDPPDPRFSSYRGQNPFQMSENRKKWEQGKERERIERLEERIHEFSKPKKPKKKATGNTLPPRPRPHDKSAYDRYCQAAGYTADNPTVMTIFAADGTPIHLSGGN